MTVNATKINDLYRLQIEGEMTIFNAADLKQRLLEHLGECSRIEVDLSQVSEMDTSGLQLLFLIKLESISSNKEVRIISHSPAVSSIVELYDVRDYFGMEEGK